MTVYTVWFDNYDDDVGILGVFSTLEKARAARTQYLAELDHLEPHMILIEEIEVDQLYV